MQNLRAKIGVQIKPVFQSKISQVLSPKEKKPSIVNNQCVVYKFQCDLCDTDYVGYTTRHQHQRVGEHKHSAIGRHLQEHDLSKSDLKDKQFSVLRKCRSKFDCLIFEMLFIKELKAGLPKRTPFVLNCLRDTACKYFLAFNSALFYSLRVCFSYIYIQITFSYSF